MKVLDMLELMTKFAKEYRQDAQKSVSRNKHMNEINDGEILQQSHIYDILVDYINFVGINHGIDYSLFTDDLKKQFSSEKK